MASPADLWTTELVRFYTDWRSAVLRAGHGPNVGAWRDFARRAQLRFEQALGVPGEIAIAGVHSSWLDPDRCAMMALVPGSPGDREPCDRPFGHTGPHRNPAGREWLA